MVDSAVVANVLSLRRDMAASAARSFPGNSMRMSETTVESNLIKIWKLSSSENAGTIGTHLASHTLVTNVVVLTAAKVP